MANPELGAKQICPTCSSKFYDLNRRPAHCPKCGAEFDPEEAMRNRRVRTSRAPLPEEEAEEVKPAPAAEVDEEFGAEPEEEAPELDAEVIEPLEVDDDEDAGPDAQPAAPEGVDFAEEDDVEEADDDVPFIEDDDDDFSEDEIDGLPEEGATDD